MRYFSRYFIVIVFLFIFNPFSLKVEAIETKKNILILNPSSETTYSNSLFEAIRTTLDEESNNLKYIISSLKGSLDKNRFSSVKSLIHMHSIDLIICLDGDSAKILQDNFDLIEKDIPIIYTTLYKPLPPHPNFSCIYTSYDLDTYLNEALKLHPNTQKINFLIDKPLKNTIFYTKIEDFIAKNMYKYEFQIIETGNINEIGTKFLGKNTLTLMYSTIKTPMKGTDGFRHTSFFGTTKHLASITTDPIYGGLKDFTTEFNTGSFNFCGYNVGIALINNVLALLEEEVTINQLGIKEYSEDKSLLINRPLASSFKIPLNNINYTYYDYRDTNTILAIQNQRFFYLIILVLVSTICTLVSIYFYKRKAYRATLSSELVKTNLVANISHELRTPLNIILSTLQLLPIFIDEGRLEIHDPIVLERFSYLKKNALRLLRLVNNIIDFTKIDAGFYTPNKNVYNIVEIIEDITLSSVDYAKKNKLTLTFDTSSEEIFCKFDRDQIERTTLNLISNAFKFTPSTGDVFVAITEDDFNAYVSVHDTGIGISPSDISLIFDRFRQAEDNLLHKNEGSGIGLSLCKSMIELNGGTISVTSTPSKGSTFTFSLEKCICSSPPPSSIENIEEKINIEYSDFIIND